MSSFVLRSGGLGAGCLRDLDHASWLAGEHHCGNGRQLDGGASSAALPYDQSASPCPISFSSAAPIPSQRAYGRPAAPAAAAIATAPSVATAPASSQSVAPAATVAAAAAVAAAVASVSTAPAALAIPPASFPPSVAEPVSVSATATAA